MLGRLRLLIMTWSKTTIRQLKENDKIKYITSAGEYIVFFKAISQGKTPSLNTYTTKDGKKVYKRPKVSSIKEVFIWEKPAVIVAPDGYTSLYTRDLFTLPKNTILTIHLKDGTIFNEVVLEDAVTNKSITVFVSTGEKKQRHVIDASNINKVFKSPSKFSESVDHRYELIAPRDYDNLYTLLKKGDLIAYSIKQGELRKGVKVLEVIRDGGIRLKLYKYPHTFYLNISSVQEFYIKKTSSSSTEVPTTPMNSSNPDLSQDLTEKVEYLYNRLEAQQKEINAIRAVHTAQINKLHKYIIKLRSGSVPPP